MSSIERMSHNDEMFSYYVQRENCAYLREAVALGAKIKNVEISHKTLDLGIVMENCRLWEAWI